MVRKSRKESDDTMDIYEKLLHLKDIKYKDHLRFLLVVSESIKTYKLVYIITAVTYSIYVSDVLLFLIELIRTFNTELILKYGCDIGITIFMTICLHNALRKGVPVVNVALNFQNNLIPIEFAQKKTQKIILDQIKLLKYYVLIDSIFAAVAAGLFAVDNDYNDNNVYFFTITKKITWMNLGQALSIYCRLSYFFLALVTISNAYLVSYIGLHSNYQLVVLQNFIDHLCDSNFSNEEDLYYDELSQRIITQRMKICIMIYQSIYSGVQNFVRMIYHETVLVLFGTLFLGGGVMIEIFRDSDIQKSVVSISFISVAGALNGLLYLICGQAIKDESTNVREKLLKLPWYNMNKKNKQLLTIFLIRTNSPVRYDSDLVEVDYLLLVRIVRGLYSVATILSRTMK